MNELYAGEARLRVGVVCTAGIGPERGGRDGNEDNYLVCRDGRIAVRDGDGERIVEAPPSPAVLVAVADGMGGHDDGEIASAAAVEAMSGLYLAPIAADPTRALREWVLESHRRLHAEALAKGPVKMGTTLTVAWILGDRLHWAQVGDSRLYHWRRGQLVQVTRDQTRAEFALRDKRSLPPGAQHLSQSFLFGSRGLGDDKGLRMDDGLDCGSLGLCEGDRLVLCSDGLTGYVGDDRIAEALGRLVDPAACATDLLEQAIAAESDDNVTVIVVGIDRRAAGRPSAPDPEEWRSADDTLVPL